jgi:hypothetical protein
MKSKSTMKSNVKYIESLFFGLDECEVGDVNENIRGLDEISNFIEAKNTVEDAGGCEASVLAIQSLDRHCGLLLWPSDIELNLSAKMVNEDLAFLINYSVELHITKKGELWFRFIDENGSIDEWLNFEDTNAIYESTKSYSKLCDWFHIDTCFHKPGLIDANIKKLKLTKKDKKEIAELISKFEKGDTLIVDAIYPNSSKNIKKMKKVL